MGYGSTGFPMQQFGVETRGTTGCSLAFSRSYVSFLDTEVLVNSCLRVRHYILRTTLKFRWMQTCSRFRVTAEPRHPGLRQRPQKIPADSRLQSDAWRLERFVDERLKSKPATVSRGMGRALFIFKQQLCCEYGARASSPPTRCAFTLF
jgi:hypothetical protein